MTFRIQLFNQYLDDGASCDLFRWQTDSSRGVETKSLCSAFIPRISVTCAWKTNRRLWNLFWNKSKAIASLPSVIFSPDGGTGDFRTTRTSSIHSLKSLSISSKSSSSSSLRTFLNVSRCSSINSNRTWRPDSSHEVNVSLNKESTRRSTLSKSAVALRNSSRHDDSNNKTSSLNARNSASAGRWT